MTDFADFQDVVELGLEGLDRFANKYHDTVHDGVRQKYNHWKPKKSPKDATPTRSRSEPPDDRAEYTSGEDDYTYDKRSSRRDAAQEYIPADNGVRGVSFRQNIREEPKGRRDYDTASLLVDGGRQVGQDPAPRGYTSGYQTLPPRAPSSPLTYIPSHRSLPPLGESGVDPRRRSSRGQSRAPSYSPARGRRPSYNRKRSNSPSEKGLAGIVIGALAGGLAGNELLRGDKFTTAAGAVIGAVGAREMEKLWEKRKTKECEVEDEHCSKRRKDKERR